MPPKTVEIRDDIHVLDGRVRLLHPQNGGFRTSLDTVMVASAVPARGADRVLDMGCGVGGASFCLLARCPTLHVTGVDIQADLIDLARANIDGNAAHGHAEFIVGNIADVNFEEPFDHVVCNPPYLEAGTYTPSPDVSRGTALGHHGQDLSLDDWLRAAHRLVKSRGSLTLIHRADHTDKIILGLSRRFGAIEIMPLWPHAGEGAKRVIIRAIKDAQGAAILHPGLVLHQADGSWTPAAEAILRHGNAFPVTPAP